MTHHSPGRRVSRKSARNYSGGLSGKMNTNTANTLCFLILISSILASCGTPDLIDLVSARIGGVSVSEYVDLQVKAEEMVK